MARITGITKTDIVLLSIQPQNSGAIQLQEVPGTQAIQSDGTYDFQLPVGIYDIQQYDIKNAKRLLRSGVAVLSTDTTITLEGLLQRY